MYRAHPQPYTLLPPARGAPQAPQAARSAAAGGGQQVRKIKRHFRFRSFATNVEIRYKSRLTRAEPPTKTTEGRADSAPPGAPQHPRVLPSCQPYSPTPGPGLVGWSPTLRTPGLQMLVGWSRTSRTRVTVGHAVTVVTAPSPGTPARLTGHCDPRDAISGWTVVRRWIWEPEEA